MRKSDFPPKRATEMTEDEFVRDTSHRVSAALSNVFRDHLPLGQDVEIALLTFLVLEISALSDEEMRDRYRKFVLPRLHEQSDHLDNEFKYVYDGLVETTEREHHGGQAGGN